MESSLQAVDTTLKVDCDGDLRRALLKGTPNYAAIDRAVQEIWPHRSAREAKYVDDEGDACTLNERTFPDFLCTAKRTATGQVLRLVLSQPSGEASVDPDQAPSATESFSSPWQHVEVGSEAGEDGLHTVADLTDIQDVEVTTPQQAPGAPLACLGTALAQEVALKSPSEEEASVMEEAAATGYSSHEVPVAKQNMPEEVHEAAPSQTRAGSMPDAFLLREEPVDDGFHVEGSTVPIEQVPGESMEDANRRFEEKTDIVIAAFDEDGDGYLSFKEIRELVRSASNDQLPQGAFEQMCADVGADAKLGLDREALMCLYSCGNSWLVLERDFGAAKKKLQPDRPEQQSRHGSANNPVSLVMKNPLLAAPFALDVAERVRQGVVSKIR